MEQKRTKPFSPSFCERAIAELLASHKGVQVVFLDKRRVGRLFCENFLKAAYHLEGEAGLQEIGEVAEEPLPCFSHPEEFMATVGSFTFGELRQNFPDWSQSRLRRLLSRLKAEGVVACRGRGPHSVWHYLKKAERSP